MILKFPSKGLRKSNTYGLEYADISSVVDFDGKQWKDDEVVGDGDMDYVRQDCERTWLDVDK